MNKNKKFKQSQENDNSIQALAINHEPHDKEVEELVDTNEVDVYKSISRIKEKEEIQNLSSRRWSKLVSR